MIISFWQRIFNIYLTKNIHIWNKCLALLSVLWLVWYLWHFSICVSSLQKCFWEVGDNFLYWNLLGNKLLKRFISVWISTWKFEENLFVLIHWSAWLRRRRLTTKSSMAPNLWVQWVHLHPQFSCHPEIILISVSLFSAPPQSCIYTCTHAT